MRFYPNKKAQLSTIREMILVLVVFIILGGFFTSCIRSAESDLKEDMCRASVFLRHEYHINALGTKIEAAPLECYTYDKEVPLEKYDGGTVNDIEKSIGDLIAKTWWMFGEGIFKANFQGEAKGSAFNFGGDTKLCHVSYRFTINDKNIKMVNYESGQPLFNSADLMTYLTTNIYFADPEYHEIYCENGKDDDSDGLTDEEDDDCTDGKTSVTNSCEQRGGVCVSLDDAVPPKYKIYKDIEWTCKGRNDLCYAPDSRSYSYLKYVQSHGDSRGTLVIGSDSELEFQMDFKAGQAYGIAMVEPLSWRYASEGGGSGFINAAGKIPPAAAAIGVGILLIAFPPAGLVAVVVGAGVAAGPVAIANSATTEGGVINTWADSMSSRMDNYHIIVAPYDTLEEYCSITDKSDERR